MLGTIRMGGQNQLFMTVSAREASISIFFGSALQNAENAALREKLACLARGQLSCSLYVDTLLSQDKPWAAADHARSEQLFLLFDFQRIFLYNDPGLNDVPGVDSVLRFILDDYSHQPFQAFARHLQQHPFQFLYELEILDLLFILLPSAVPGQVMVLNPVTAEVNSFKAHFHPEAERTNSAFPVLPASRVPPPPAGGFVLQNRIVSRNMRLRKPEGLDEFVGPQVGIIRSERGTFRYSLLPGAVARITYQNGTDDVICGGKHLRLEHALGVARCEVIERFHLLFPYSPEPVYFGSYAELREKHAIDPRSLFFKIKPAHGENQKWVEYDDSLPTYWTWAYNPLRGQSQLVPAQEVWFTNRLPGENLFISSTTNGCALGSSIEEAALFGLLEAVERDAYLTMWYLQRPCEKIDPESVDYEPFRFLWAKTLFLFPEYSIHFFNVTNDTAIPSIAAIAVRERGSGPKTIHASAARLHAGPALFKALVDIAMELGQGYPTPDGLPRKELLESPERIATPEDHRDLYALEEMFDRHRFLDLSSAPRFDSREIKSCGPPLSSSYDLKKVLTSVLAHFEDLGMPVLIKDITNPTFAKRGLFCVKALAPGLYPLWFGYYSRRAPASLRLKELASRFQGRTVETEQDMNLEIHPLC
jgi:thiazole/oxazole-forming peptide maturase SagD family component